MQLNKLNRNDIALAGIPFDLNSSFMKGAASAPDIIRQSMHSESSNLCSELGVELFANPRLVDVGDLHLSELHNSYFSIESFIDEILQLEALPLLLGGDHSITYPIMRAMHRSNGPVNILHFDAHPDLYNDYQGNPYSHASPFARIMEDGLAKRLVQVGIRTLNREQKEQADRFGVEIHEMKDINLPSIGRDFEGPVYISCDMDAFDPAYAPGVSHHEPGGLSVRDVLGIIQQLPNLIIGADIVEYNPLRDINNMTAMVAAKLSKEVAGRMIQNSV